MCYQLWQRLLATPFPRNRTSWLSRNIPQQPSQPRMGHHLLMTCQRAPGQTCCYCSSVDYGLWIRDRGVSSTWERNVIEKFLGTQTTGQDREGSSECTRTPAPAPAWLADLAAISPSSQVSKGWGIINAAQMERGHAMKQQHVLAKFNLSKRCCHEGNAECLLNSFMQQTTDQMDVDSQDSQGRGWVSFVSCTWTVNKCHDKCIEVCRSACCNYSTLCF